MFGSQVHWITFIILVLQVIILPFLYINYLYDKSKKHKRKFIFLTIYIILYNLFSGLFPDENIDVPIILQYIIAYLVGILYVIYFVYYLYSEFHINPKKYLSLKSIAYYLTGTFILLFIIPLVFGNGLNFARKLFITIPLIISIFFSIVTIRQLFTLYITQAKTSTQQYYKSKIIAANFGVISILMLPILISIGDYQYIEQPVVNLGYFVMLFIYIKDQIYTQRVNNDLLNNLIEYKNEVQTKNKFQTINLTSKETEIAGFILQDYKYKEIADCIFITEKTVSKHASNIFKKANVGNRIEFSEKFKNL
ncbi:putative Regulatory LuxR family protein [Tenacibaculum sp. 190524A02b]|uniref:Regulatory LuxR family protein n=1 Tax=Tenacibaculum vairaonense TaxID=3137860 RepID=A0ABP1F7Z2_9FLAO